MHYSGIWTRSRRQTRHLEDSWRLISISPQPKFATPQSRGLATQSLPLSRAWTPHAHSLVCRLPPPSMRFIYFASAAVTVDSSNMTHLCTFSKTTFFYKVRWPGLHRVLGLRHHQLRGVDSAHLQILLMGMCRQCDSWSAAEGDLARPHL